jgi:hypothetical protein
MHLLCVIVFFRKDFAVWIIPLKNAKRETTFKHMHLVKQRDIYIADKIARYCLSIL